MIHSSFRSSPTCQKDRSSVNANRKMTIAVRSGKIELKSLWVESLGLRSWGFLSLAMLLGGMVI